MACKCASTEFKTKDDLKQYDFIALVEINGLAPIVNKEYGTRKNDDIRFITMELFKGRASSQGKDPGFDSDCVLNLKIGERWLFFGYKAKGKLQISFCSATVKYAEANGVRDWWYLTGITELRTLRKLYGHPLPANVGNKVFYANGKIEIVQSISNGMLNGTRKIYYPSGRLHIIEQFRHNKRVGYRNAYSQSGQLTSNVIYKNGLISKITFYQDSAVVISNMKYEARRSPYPQWYLEPKPVKKKLDSLLKTIAWLHISYVKRFESNGRGYKLYQYYTNGKTEHEESVDWKRKIAIEIDYKENGKLTMHNTYDKRKDKQIENYYWDEGPQKVVKKCGTCEFYFDTIKPSEATPEAVYIQ
jgi:antitoxin component YwqK of YwqJK toxin-antitoxin module